MALATIRRLAVSPTRTWRSPGFSSRAVSNLYSESFEEFLNKFEKPARDKLRLPIETFNELVKHVENAGGEFVLNSPEHIDYVYLVRDIVTAITEHDGKKPIINEELCKKLVGAGTGFVGSVGLRAFGTFVVPGWGTAIGGYYGYTYGKKFGIEVAELIFRVGPHTVLDPICDSIKRDCDK